MQDAVKTISWPLDSAWTVESYASALELEQEHRQTLENVLSRILHKLNLSASEPPPADQIRALFARYQQPASSPTTLLSQMVADMREE